MSQRQELYQYRKLFDSDAIRLIVLQPSMDLEDQVKCDLLHTSLTKCEEDIIDHYTAISYVWGDLGDTRKISIDDGKMLSITATLDSALRHIRAWDRPIRLWADAICINQSDIDERNHQVRQIGAIYACALHTIIYFGPSIPEAELFLEFLRISNANIRKGYSVEFSLPLSVSNLGSGFIDMAVKYLLIQPWLTRIWVLQEVVFSQNPWIQCGRARSRWQDFCKFVKEMEPPTESAPQPPLPMQKSLIGLSSDRQYPSSIDSQTQDQKYFKGRELLLSMSRFRERFYDQAASSAYGHRLLLELLRSRRGLGVSDPRDLLFAHTIIARSSEVTEMHQHLLQVDYNKNCTEIYERITIYFMKQLNDFSILSAIGDIDKEFRRPEIPSWAPDWTFSMPSLPWVEIGAEVNQMLTVKFNGRGSDYLSMQPGGVERVTHLLQRWSIPADRTCVWLPSTLAWVGVEVAIVGGISPIIKWPLPYFDIENFFKEKIGEANYEEGIDRTIYEELWNNLDVEIGPDSLDINNRHEICRVAINTILRDKQKLSSRYENSWIATSQHLLPRLVEDTIMRNTSIFHGRRLAALPDGRLALVPASTRPDDTICCLAGSEIPYVVREHQAAKQMSDDAIQQALAEAGGRSNSTSEFDCRACQYHKASCDRKNPCMKCKDNNWACACEYDNHYDVRSIDIKHYIFIGECFVEDLMFSWSAPVLEDLDKRIFAIH